MSSNQFTFAGSLRQPFSEAQTRDSYLPPLASATPDNQCDPVLMGDSLAIRRLRSQVQRIAPYFRSALIRGETGSGKQLVARAIHALSPGAGGPFIVANASALAQSLAGGESSPCAASLLESAHAGTLYLESVGELAFSRQAALFRFIRACDERRNVPAPTNRNDSHRTEPVRIDTRILASSDRDLRVLAAIGQFRQDLYASLSAVEILVPPLRQRVEDIPLLVAWLLHRIAGETGQCPKLLAKSTLAQLQQRLWPNNLRELERVVAQAAALTEGPIVEPRHLLALVEPAPASPVHSSAIHVERLHDVIQQHVLDVLTRCGGNKLRAAELLGISRSTLYRMLDASSVSTESRAS
ncbi:MAG: sigma-54-dependent transcriptional regulator [Acidobacteriaceae bacterium]